MSSQNPFGRARAITQRTRRTHAQANDAAAKEAVEVAERPAHEQISTHLLMDVFSRLRELGREVEAIPFNRSRLRRRG
jgi:hypothetical protein